MVLRLKTRESSTLPGLPNPLFALPVYEFDYKKSRPIWAVFLLLNPPSYHRERVRGLVYELIEDSFCDIQLVVIMANALSMTKIKDNSKYPYFGSTNKTKLIAGKFIFVAGQCAKSVHGCM